MKSETQRNPLAVLEHDEGARPGNRRFIVKTALVQARGRDTTRNNARKANKPPLATPTASRRLVERPVSDADCGWLGLLPFVLANLPTAVQARQEILWCLKLCVPQSHPAFPLITEADLHLQNSLFAAEKARTLEAAAEVAIQEAVKRTANGRAA